MSSNLNNTAQGIDIGVNFAGKHYKNASFLTELIRDSENKGVKSFISISNAIREITINTKLSQRYENLFFTSGCHPHNAKEITEEDSLHFIEKVATNSPKCVAIGECGLDYNRMFSPKEKQIEIFSQQIEIAKRTNLPLYLHCRDAFEDMVDVLEKGEYFKGVVHCFTGTMEEAKKFVELGFYIGITGWVCDNRRNQSLLEALEIIPFDKILIETDAPWVSVDRKRNSQPADIFVVLQKIADVKKIDFETAQQQILDNTRALFSNLNI